MKTFKALTAMSVTVLCASLFLFGDGFERIGQVALSIYALLMFLILFAKDSRPADSAPIRLPGKVLARMCYLYVVVVSAYTGHMIIAFILALTWIFAWAQQVLRQAEKDKQIAE